ncbi:hypothetical protein PG993_010272 [Apiospora rasikravindrae]|uniref:Uncharacterized protein n=1 Tax=Apiospora rasikravindrae TaxID=990691 RepID=A0ABR1SLU1_9PEZI
MTLEINFIVRQIFHEGCWQTVGSQLLRAIKELRFSVPVFLRLITLRLIVPFYGLIAPGVHICHPPSTNVFAFLVLGLNAAEAVTRRGRGRGSTAKCVFILAGGVVALLILAISLLMEVALVVIVTDRTRPITEFITTIRTKLANPSHVFSVAATRNLDFAVVATKVLSPTAKRTHVVRILSTMVTGIRPDLITLSIEVVVVALSPRALAIVHCLLEECLTRGRERNTVLVAIPGANLRASLAASVQMFLEGCLAGLQGLAHLVNRLFEVVSLGLLAAQVVDDSPLILDLLLVVLKQILNLGALLLASLGNDSVLSRRSRGTARGHDEIDDLEGLALDRSGLGGGAEAIDDHDAQLKGRILVRVFLGNIAGGVGSLGLAGESGEWHGR